MIIRHNIGSMNTSRNGGIAEGKLMKSMEKLSTGYRINRAGDDAAGLAISERMRMQINGLDQAMRNVDDGISLSQTGDGALTEVHAMLGRMKTLAIEAANGTYSSQARIQLDMERLELMDEIDRISASTNFDGIPLFEAEEFPDPLLDPPQKVGQDITLQIGYSRQETMDVGYYYMGSKALKLDQISFATVDQANESVPYIEQAIQAVSQVRADFGAVQSHLEHTGLNLGVTTENMTAAESQIRDTNMAEEFTNYTKDSILNNANRYIQAQANAIPQMVLNLLQ